MGNWTFGLVAPGQVRRDPFEAEFFVGSEESEHVYGRTDALVRETVQNALDARAGDGPARVRFVIRDPHQQPSADAREAYLGGLVPHLLAAGNDFLAAGVASRPMRVLLYEDFGTRGLCGDPARTEDPPADGSAGWQDFYWFWRNVGRSGKSGQDLGRWGLGKSVLPATSKVNTMFGLTVRPDGRRLLMGQAVLKTHRIDAEQFLPEGFYHGKTDPHGVPLPVEGGAECDAFAGAFGLSRRRDECGLSVVVPFGFDTLAA